MVVSLSASDITACLYWASVCVESGAMPATGDPSTREKKSDKRPRKVREQSARARESLLVGRRLRNHVGKTDRQPAPILLLHHVRANVRPRPACGGHLHDRVLWRQHPD